MKAPLSAKRKNVSVILGSKKMPLPQRDKQWYYDRLKAYCEEHCVNYAFILHDKDKNEDGSDKFLHIHMALTMVKVNKDYKKLNTILNELAKEVEIDGQSIQIDEMTSENGSIQYLIHKRDPQKAQYVESDVCSNYTPEELHTIMEAEIDTMCVSYLLQVVDECEYNRIEIMKKIGLRYYKEYRNVILDIINTKQGLYSVLQKRNYTYPDNEKYKEVM